LPEAEALLVGKAATKENFLPVANARLLDWLVFPL
jgi:hypothetical protein